MQIKISIMIGEGGITLVKSDKYAIAILRAIDYCAPYSDELTEMWNEIEAVLPEDWAKS